MIAIYSMTTGCELFTVDTIAQAWRAINDPALRLFYGDMFIYQ